MISIVSGTPLCVRLPNWVGDLVMALPTLVELENAGFALNVVGRSWANDLLAGFGWPVTVAGSGIWSTGRVLRRMPARQGLLLTNSLSSALAMRLGKIGAIGYRTDGRSLLLNCGLVKRPGLHEVEYFWRLGEVAHARWGDGSTPWPTSPPDRIELALTAAHKSAAIAALAEHGVNEPFVVCCPAATGRVGDRAKVWPHFAELCQALIASGRRVVACPGPSEVEACTQSLPGATIMRGLPLGAYAAVLQAAERVVANDSGPMHLAAAVSAPVVGIFGITDPQRTRPWGGHYVGSASQWPSVANVLAALDALPERDHSPAQQTRVLRFGQPDLATKAA